MIKTIIPLLLSFYFGINNINAQTWVDSLDTYAREEMMPPSKYKWTWQKAALLFTMCKQYELKVNDNEDTYMDYVQTAMDKKYKRANGKSPNAVASGLGMSFLSLHNKGDKYDQASLKIFNEYLKIKRANNGGVSHKRFFKELWDDTIFMIGIYLQNMYLWTKDEKYIDELFLQINAHRDMLLDKTTGLWVHGWDGDNRNRCNFCGQSGWSKNPEKRSEELWGRGNGWVIVTLAETIKVLPKGHPKRIIAKAYLKEMIKQLPEVQDEITGHWFQLPMRPKQAGNFIESSATAMFAYGILVALQENIVSEDRYKETLALAYKGLREHSVKPIGNGYLGVKNVCKGTCIGDMNYYLNRSAKNQKPYGIAMFILFGRAYEDYLSKK